MDIFTTIQDILSARDAVTALGDPAGAIGDWLCAALVEETECGSGFPTEWSPWWYETTGFSAFGDVLDDLEAVKEDWSTCRGNN